MAALRGRAQPTIGSAQWIQDENAQVALFCGQEAEDFACSARNEVEWLNEHMAEILSKDQMNVADIFKTPGKLRGKTPRTARKRNALEAREPLSEIFTTNAQPSPRNVTRTSPSKVPSPPKIAAFKVAADEDDGKKRMDRAAQNTDSGYHGLPDEEMEVDTTVQSSADTHDTLEDFPHSPSLDKAAADTSTTDRSTTERSFHSARDDFTKKDALNVSEPQKPGQIELATTTSDGSADGNADEMEVDSTEKDPDGHEVLAESRSSSQASSPARGLVRKSSLTFAALPAREPITTKKSLGNGASRPSQLDQYKSSNMQSSLLGRLTGGKSLGGSKQPEAQDEMTGEESLDRRPGVREEFDHDSRMTKLHNKSSTQRLHERINLLGKSQPPRPTKSIPALNSATQPAYPDLSKQGQQKQMPPSTTPGSFPLAQEDDEDDWIEPPQQSKATQARPQLTKSISADIVESLQGKQIGAAKDINVNQSDATFKPATAQNEATIPLMRQKAVANHPKSPLREAPKAPPPAESLTDANGEIVRPAISSTTPLGSPMGGRYVDGPLSASKSKLQSIMTTARGLFSSSANLSAQARLGTMSPRVATNERGELPPVQIAEIRTDDTSNPQTKEPQPNAPKATLDHSKPTFEPRKTRSSSEKEAREKDKEAVDRRQLEREKEQLREQEAAIKENAQSKPKAKEPGKPPIRPTRQSPRKPQQRDNAQDNESLAQAADPAPHDQKEYSQTQKPKEARRPIKIGKDGPSQAKAPPVNIRIGMPSRRVPLNNTALSSNLHDSLPPAHSKPPGLVKKASNASIQSSGPSGVSKCSAPTQKPKALIAAERKKEQDEREAQRKLEQKREIERRRAAQQEEARRQEQLQRQEAEKQREKDRAAAAEDSKKTAQRQAIEKRRLELQKKDQRPNNKAMNDHAGVQNSQAGSTSRPELGGNRPPSRQANALDQQRPANTHQAMNPSKAPIKRVFDPENDNVPVRPAKPHASQNYQQNDSKRRRTEDEEPEEFPMRPTMAPPIRQSGMRKDGPKPSIFSHAYNPAPPPASHHAHSNSLLKSTTTSQAYQQHLQQGQQPRPGYQLDTSKYRDGNRIPFAENPNPPHTQHHVPSQQPFKTPLPSKVARPSRQSPHYPNGEHIQLQEIPTDSEDSDSSPDTAQKRQRAASLPEWVQSPYLNNALRSQEEYMDADAVFGPIGSPHLEEMFRERAHKFRPRTSSANWAGQDRLTQDEIRRDVDARARIRREGGWTFGGAT